MENVFISFHLLLFILKTIQFGLWAIINTIKNSARSQVRESHANIRNTEEAVLGPEYFPRLLY